ncbi:MAG: hypothetical protein ABFS32_20270 [Bacteroidota bacterium]
MGIVKFKKTFSINKIGSIAEFDNELCDKLIDRGVCEKATDLDIKADKEAKNKMKKIAEKNIKEAEKHNKLMKQLHSPIDLKSNKKAIATIRANNLKKGKKK